MSKRYARSNKEQKIIYIYNTPKRRLDAMDKDKTLQPITYSDYVALHRRGWRTAYVGDGVTKDEYITYDGKGVATLPSPGVNVILEAHTPVRFYLSSAKQWRTLNGDLFRSPRKGDRWKYVP